MYAALYESLSNQDKVDRGERAKQFLADECFNEVIKDLCVSLHNGLDHMPSSNPDDIMQVVNQIRAVRNIRQKLEGWVSQGNVITAQGIAHE